MTVPMPEESFSSIFTFPLIIPSNPQKSILLHEFITPTSTATEAFV